MSTQTIIREESRIVTLINVFTVDKENQEALVDLLVHATEETMQNIDGFISANIHRSVDGKSVANYAQWKSRDAFLAMLQNPEAKPHMDAALALSNAPNAANLYEITSKHGSD